MKVLKIITLLAITGCSTNKKTYRTPQTEDNCLVSSTSTEVTVQCPPDKEKIIQKSNDACYLEEGSNPPMIVCGDTEVDFSNKDASNGVSCTVIQATNGANIVCEDGTQAFISNGANGADGIGCSAVRVSNGAIIQCGDDSVLINDGIDGLDGSFAGISEIIDPCGDNPSNFDEVLLKLSSGEIVAYFEDKGAKFLTILSPGFYTTTDKQKCSFEVTSSGDVL